MTFTFVSEYSSTASVFSSCGGTGAFTTACIHCGASLPATAGVIPSTTRATLQSRNVTRVLLTRAGSHRLQQNLFFIARPHQLKEVPYCGIIVGINQEKINRKFA